MNGIRQNRAMDRQSVQSDTKFKSDFSIERILGEEVERREDVPSPSWLCCTRYRPPRLTRTTNSVSRARRSGRHARVPFTAAQASALEAAYARAPYLAPPALRALASALQLRDDRIKIWFQNRRARERREKSTNINPPSAMTLLPTSPPDPVLMSTTRTPDHRIYLNKTQNPTALEQCVNATSQRYPIRPTELSLLRFDTSFTSDDQNLEDRCDSPLDVET